MKHIQVQYLLAVLLLAAMAIPSVGDGANRQDSRKAVTAPSVIADAFPTPWPKKPGGVVTFTESSLVIADAFPTPWPKKPGSVPS